MYAQPITPATTIAVKVHAPGPTEEGKITIIQRLQSELYRVQTIEEWPLLDPVYLMGIRASIPTNAFEITRQHEYIKTTRT